MRKIIYTLIGSLLTACTSDHAASRSFETAISTPVREMRAAGINPVMTIRLAVASPQQAKSLVVSHSTRGFITTILPKDITENTLYDYHVKTDDPQTFTLVFTLVYTDNTRVSTRVNIDHLPEFHISEAKPVARVTGATTWPEQLPNPNNTDSRWNVGGTDLGIVWETAPGHYALFFGDTYDRTFRPDPLHPGPNGGTWRSNVLAFSADTHLEDGITFSEMETHGGTDAAEIIPGGKDTSGSGNWTSIPTAAIAVGGKQYVHYFNMRNWTGWQLNYSSVCRSNDGGHTWQRIERLTYPTGSRFAMAAYARLGDYIYMMGTPSGRTGYAYMARVREDRFEDPQGYQYWDGGSGQWTEGKETAATPIIEEPVGEASLIYHPLLHKWLTLYFSNDRYEITLRTADRPEGPWSPPYSVATGAAYPQLYGSFFHPISATGREIYFTMSQWLPYNVFLMRFTIEETR